MSVAVPLVELAAAMERHDYAFVLSVADDGRPRILSLRPVWRGDSLLLDLGPSGRRNATERPLLTLVFPSPDPDGFSLVVDGTASVEAEFVVFVPSRAVLHRPAPARLVPEPPG